MLFSSELQLLLLKKLKLSVMLVYNKAQDTEAFFLLFLCDLIQVIQACI